MLSELQEIQRRLQSTDVPTTQVIFDTLKMVRSLESSGFTKPQSEALSDALVGVSTESMRVNRDFLATKNDFVDLKSELQILEKADFAVLKSDLQILERKMETKIAAIYTEMERSKQPTCQLNSRNHFRNQDLRRNEPITMSTTHRWHLFGQRQAH